jgi:hypothetical protein
MGRIRSMAAPLPVKPVRMSGHRPGRSMIRFRRMRFARGSIASLWMTVLGALHPAGPMAAFTAPSMFEG